MSCVSLALDFVLAGLFCLPDALIYMYGLVRCTGRRWNAQSKEINIELAPPTGWDIAGSVWPSVTTVVDDFDAPWGLVRKVANWSKPTHLRGRLGSVQHTHLNTSTTILLATLDIDAAQPAPDGGREGPRGERVDLGSSPLLICNASQAKHGMGWGGNYQIVDQRALPSHAVLPAALDQCAASCCAHDNCTGWAVKP